VWCVGLFAVIEWAESDVWLSGNAQMVRSSEERHRQGCHEVDAEGRAVNVCGDETHDGGVSGVVMLAAHGRRDAVARGRRNGERAMKKEVRVNVISACIDLAHMVKAHTARLASQPLPAQTCS
jgi:hypothetical protein